MSQDMKRSQKCNRYQHNDITSIRFLHNIIDAPTVSIYIDNILFVGKLSYKSITSYLTINTGKHIVSITADDNSIFKQTIHIKTTGTFVIAGSVKQSPMVISLLKYKDNLSCPEPGYYHLRFLHTAYAVPAVDIWLGNVKIFNNISYPNAGTPEYLALKLGKLNITNRPDYYNITVTLANTNNIVIGPIPIAFISGGIYTIFATGEVNNKLTAIISNDNQFKLYTECEKLQENFNIEKYMGKWYQIASIPQFYDTGCIRSTAIYTLLENKVNVYNTCYKINDQTSSINGEAFAPNPCIPSALNVSFVSNICHPNTNPNYLIHYTNYTKYAIVGSPSRLSFYILARKNTISIDRYNKILDYAKYLGYDITLIKVDEGAIQY